MVERPIKKSERQSQPSTDNDSQSSDSAPPVESTRKVLKLDDVAPRRERKGKKSSSKDDSKQPQQINPALVRGPKPPKPQPKVEAEPEPESEPDSEPTPEE